MPYTKKGADGVSAIERAKKRNILKRQRIATVLLAVVALLLVAALAAVLYIVDIYSFEDVNGDEYLIKKVDGKYALCYKDGAVCSTTEYQNKTCYLTSIGTIVSVDAESGDSEIKVIVDTDGTEIQDYDKYVLMFKKLTYDEDSVKDKSMIIKSIEVENSINSYTFIRDENDDFVLLGNEATPISAQNFAQFASACGYTLSTYRLEKPQLLSNGRIDYAEYGLAEEDRIRIETDDNGNETEVEYRYIPTRYKITAMNGDYYEVTVGDMAVTGTGFYAKYEGGMITVTENGKTVTRISEGRDTVYVLNAPENILDPDGFQGYDLINGRIENFATPIIVYPMGLTEYFNVSDFVLYNSIDYDKIYGELAEKFTEDQTGSKEFLEEYGKLFEKYSHKVCDFTFYDMNERQGSMNMYIPYISNLDYADGYYLNSDNVDIMLYGFYNTEFGEIIKIAPDEDELSKYGLINSPYVINFFFKTENEKGETVYIENFVDISEKSADGWYYAYSSTYDMIVSINESSFNFLEWDETYWYDESYIQLGISNVDSILIESPAFSTKFEIEDSASKFLAYVGQSGNKITVGDREYSIAKNESGKYVLKHNGANVTPLYSGDYLITPVVYNFIEAQADNYIFSESSETDINGDGQNDAVIYYFYDILYKDGQYHLVAQVVMSDYNGNPLSETKTVFGEIAYSSPYFMTKNGYLFFSSKYSSIGMNIEEKYGKNERGVWGEGNVFVTSNGQKILIDQKTANLMLIDDISCGLYLADREDSRLSERAVEIPAKYNADGKLIRYSDIYYPLTDKKIQYDEELDIIVAYNKLKKEWEKITYSDCTIGMWGDGEYYVLEGGILIMVDSRTGDWGEVAVLSSPIYVADIYADGKLLNYTIEKEGFSASSQSATAMQNFQELYKYLLTASFEGIADLDEAQKEAFRQKDDFTSGKDAECVLKITLTASDFKGNEREVVYRFYRYSERRAYLTVETLDGSGSSSEKAYGNFSVLYSFVRKVIEDSQKVTDAQPVYSTEKY